MNVLLTFATVGAALDCELIFKELEIPCRVVPVSRTSSSCVFAISTETEDPEGLGDLLRQRGAEYVKIFEIEEG
ncbi:MAG: DUF3343 domain-containing protein [Treponema sp.]|nr:DUF3343 domain-containing protein [Treponema sp.]